MLQAESSQNTENSPDQPLVVSPVLHDPTHSSFNFDDWAVNVRAQMITALRKRNHFETVDDIRARHC